MWVKPFRFKKFTVNHSQSSMPVSMDSIILGAWTEVAIEGEVLDVGTGCGLLALMCAQRMPDVRIKAIDIDELSINEASYNISVSPWDNRIVTELVDFSSYIDKYPQDCFNLIISNPPFYHAGLKNPVTSRQMARHDSSLSPLSFIDYSAPLIKYGGRISLMAPTEREQEIFNQARINNLTLYRWCKIKHKDNLPFKRTLFEFIKLKNRDLFISPVKPDILIITDKGGKYSEKFKDLCGDFYL